MKLALFGIALLISFSSLANTPKFKICFERWWPYSFVNKENIPKGIEVELIQLATQPKGIAVEFQELPYQRCLDSVRHGTHDFTLHVDRTDNLTLLDKSFTDWSLSLAVKQGRFTQMSQLNTLAPRIMLAMEYPYPDEVYKRLKEMNAVIVERSFYEQSDEEAMAFFDVLENERIDAIIVDRQWASKMIRQYRLPVTILPEAFHNEPQFIGFREDRKEQAALLHRLLIAIPAPVKEQIHAKYLIEH